MKVVKKTSEYTIFEKRNGRHAVKSAKKKTINGDEKVKILLAEGLIKIAEPKAPEPADVEPTEEEKSSEEE